MVSQCRYLPPPVASAKGRGAIPKGMPLAFSVSLVTSSRSITADELQAHIPLPRRLQLQAVGRDRGCMARSPSRPFAVICGKAISSYHRSWVCRPSRLALPPRATAFQRRTITRGTKSRPSNPLRNRRASTSPPPTSCSDSKMLQPEAGRHACPPACDLPAALRSCGLGACGAAWPT